MWLKQHPSLDWQKSLIVVLNLSPTDTYMRKLQLALSISNQWLKDVVQKNQTGGINSEIRCRDKLYLINYYANACWWYLFCTDFYYNVSQIINLMWYNLLSMVHNPEFWSPFRERKFNPKCLNWTTSLGNPVLYFHISVHLFNFGTNE